VPLDNARNAWELATQLPRRPKLWLALAALSPVPVLNILVLGYLARVAAEETQDPPPLRPLGRTFVLGLKVLAVALAYSALAAFVALLALAAALSALPPGARAFLAAYGGLLLELAALLTALILLMLFAALGVPVALVIAARRGVRAALNPVNSWRVIRRAGIGEYLAYLAAVALFGLSSLLPGVGAAVFGAAGYVALLLLFLLIAPVAGAFLWHWGGLMVGRAEGRA